MKKKIFSRMMAAILFFGLSVQPVSVYAENAEFTSGMETASETDEFTSVQPEVSGTSEIDASGFGDGTGMQPETEEIADMPAAGAGDSISEATAVSIGKTYEGSITTTNTADVYKFTLNSSGNLTIESTALIPWINYYLYDSTGKSIWSSWYSEGTAGQCNISEEFDLTKGTYYLGILKYGNSTGDYSFRLSFTSSGESFSETGTGNNNMLAEADSISLGSTYKGQIAYNDEKDFYKFSIGSSGKVTVSATLFIPWINFYIYDDSGESIWSSWYSEGTAGQISVNEQLDLIKGSYYLGIIKYGDYTGNYSFKITSSGAGESFAETENGTNNTLAEADDITPGRTYKGQIAINDSKDYYKFTITSPGKYTLNSSLAIDAVYFTIYDSTGKRVWSDSYVENVSQSVNFSQEMEIHKGTYYLGIEQYGKHTGNYSFELAPSSVISGDANGLILYEGEWIFVANGVIQSQHTGLALYDGEWFYINKGKLDTTINRLVEYDGGLFVVAVGRIVREVNGLWQNPADGLWYYIAEGQVQKQYTGAAQYDGSWFYIIEGKLASNFNGTIVYDGATFKVVAGQLY